MTLYEETRAFIAEAPAGPLDESMRREFGSLDARINQALRDEILTMRRIYDEHGNAVFDYGSDEYREFVSTLAQGSDLARFELDEWKRARDEQA